MNRKTALSLTLALALSLALTGCSNSTKAPTEPGKQTAPAAKTTAGVTADKPLLVEEASRTIRLYATVNGKYLVEPTRHGLNFKEGKAAAMALFVTPVNQVDFYDALIKLNAKPGNNLKIDSKGKTVEGQRLAVKVTWDGAGKEYDINDVVVDSTGKKIEYRFGGNLEASKQYLTGCFLCLDSCPVGIASNSAHTFGEFDSKQVEFRGNKSVLPADGTPIAIIVSVLD